VLLLVHLLLANWCEWTLLWCALAGSFAAVQLVRMDAAVGRCCVVCCCFAGANGAAVGVMRMDAVQCAGVWYAAVLLLVWRHCY